MEKKMGLKEVIENHPMRVFGGAVVLAFVAGWGANVAVVATAGQELILKTKKAELEDRAALGTTLAGQLKTCQEAPKLASVQPKSEVCAGTQQSSAYDAFNAGLTTGIIQRSNSCKAVMNNEQRVALMGVLKQSIARIPELGNQSKSDANSMAAVFADVGGGRSSNDFLYELSDRAIGTIQRDLEATRRPN